jgi:DNA-binding winged helix-turn-helix (wHTH) protein
VDEETVRNGLGVHHRFGDVDVDISNVRVTVAGEARPLEPKSFRLLQFLIENRGRAVPKEEILAAVWPETFVSDNALTRAVAQIRKALGDDAREPRYIGTVPTIGYRFLPELAPPAVEPALPPAPSASKSNPPRLALAILALTAIVVTGWQISQHARGGISQEPTPVQLTTVPWLAIGGSFNPDGSALVFSSNRNGWFEIYTRPAETHGAETQITSDGKQNIEPAWSPDGKTIAYHSVARRGIWAIPASGGTPRQLAPFGASPTWSPDGKRIAFRSSEPFSFAWVDWGSAAESTIWVAGADGSGLRQLTNPQNPPGKHVDPAWSPDSSRVVFIAMQQGPQGIAFNNLWTADTTTGGLAHIATGALADQASPMFGADGREIYLVAAELPDSASALVSSGRGVELLSKFTRCGTPEPMRPRSCIVPGNTPQGGFPCRRMAGACCIRKPSPSVKSGSAVPIVRTRGRSIKIRSFALCNPPIRPTGRSWPMRCKPMAPIRRSG